MAELHEFRDDAKSKEDRVKPIIARHLDENFKTVRLKLDSTVEAVFKIVETPGVNDMLALADGAPTSGTWALAVVEGVLTFVETEECE